MAYFNENFIKNVSKRVDDCSSVSQLREFLNRYKHYVFNNELKNVFISRIEFFKSYYLTDVLVQSQCEDLMDDLEIEVQIASVCCNNIINNEGNSDIYPEVVNFNEFSYNTNEELLSLKKIFEYFNGIKLDICRYLNVSNSDLNSKIEQYKLKSYLNTVRRDFRNNLEIRMRE